MRAGFALARSKQLAPPLIQSSRAPQHQERHDNPIIAETAPTIEIDAGDPFTAGARQFLARGRSTGAIRCHGSRTPAAMRSANDRHTLALDVWSSRKNIGRTERVGGCHFFGIAADVCVGPRAVKLSRRRVA